MFIKNKKPLLLSISVSILSVLFQSTVQAQEDDPALGISVGAWNKSYSFRVFEKTSIKEKEAARLIGFGTEPVIRVTTKNLASGKGRFRFTIEGGYSQFTTEKQDHFGREVDYGTSVDVKYYFIMPVIAFHSGADETSDSSKQQGFMLSAGYGLMHFEAEGNYVDTRIGHFTGQKETVSISKNGDLIDMYVGYQIQSFKFGFRLVGGGYQATDETTENSYGISEAGLDLTYTLYL